MFGYACYDTDFLMLAAIYYANALAKKLHDASCKNNILQHDAKTQATVSYENGKFKDITNIIISTQHIVSASQKEIENLIINDVIKKTIPSSIMNKDIIFLVNPSGRW